MVNLLDQQPLVIDGGMATELSKQGIDTTSPLWSAMAAAKFPNAVQGVHRQYFEAGASVATTDSFVASIPTLVNAGMSLTDARHLVRATVKLAKRARDDYRADSGSERPLLIAGGVGPYAEYSDDPSESVGNYALTIPEYQRFHRERMQLLAAAGVDLFAFETQPNFTETQALTELLECEFPDKTAWLSFSVDDQGNLWDGTPLWEVVSYFEPHPQIDAIGVNCLAPDDILDMVATIKQVTTKPIIVYPNNGAVFDAETQTWSVDDQAPTLESLASQWLAAGVSIIGGCCGTTPDDIHSLARVVNKTSVK